MILGSSDFTGNFIIVDGATAPLVSIASGADYVAISMDKAADQVQDLNKAVLTLANALPVVTGNLTVFAGATALAKREVKSLNAELAKTIGLMSGLSVVSSSGIPLTGGGSTARIGTGGRGRHPTWNVDAGAGGLLPRGKDATFQGSQKLIGAPRFSRTGALGYYKEPQIIRSLGTGKIGALLNHPETETSRNIARKMAQGTSFAEAEKIIRRGYTDTWREKHRLNELLSRPIKRLVPVKTPLKKDVLSSPKTPFYVKEAIENAVFREIEGKENVPDAGSVFRDVQKYFNSVGAGSATAPDEDIIQRRYARDGALMKRISSVVNEFTGKKGAYSSYNPHLNQRMFKAFTEGEDGMKLSKLERSILETLRGDKKLLSKFSGPAQGISWRIGEDRGFRMNDLAIMSGLPTSELAQKSEMLKPGEFDDWIAKEYVNRNLLGLKKAQVMKTTWRTGEREPIYPARNWQKEVIKSLQKGQLTELTNIRKGQWTEEALAKESFRRIRKGIPLHFDTLFDKNPELLPKADLLPGRSAPFVSDEGMDASLRRALRSMPYQTTLRDIAARQALPKTASHRRANIMEDAVNSMLADVNKRGVFPSNLEIKKRHDRSFLREKIQKGFVKTQFWETMRSPLLSEDFAGRKPEVPGLPRANQAKFFEFEKEQRRWESHLGSLRAGRGIKTREQLILDWDSYTKEHAPLSTPRKNQEAFFEYERNKREREFSTRSLETKKAIKSRGQAGMAWDFHAKKQTALNAFKARREYEQRLRDSLRIIPARGSVFESLKPNAAAINKLNSPRAIRLRALEEAFSDIDFGYGASRLASRAVEGKFKGMGNKAIPASTATRAFSNALKEMGLNTQSVARGTHFFEKRINALDEPLKRAAFSSAIFGSRLGSLGSGFTHAGGKARGFGMISAIAFNEPMLAMVAMLGMMPPLIGGFAALGAAALGLGGAFALLGIAGAMAWGDKLKGTSSHLAAINKEFGSTGSKAAGSTDKMSYSVQGLTSDIGGLALVVNEFKKQIGPVFTEFGKLWVPFMEKLPASIGGAFRKIFSAIAPFSSMIQHDAMAVGGWLTKLISGFLSYSLGLLRNPEIRSSFKTIMDAIPKYGKKGMDFIVKAFLENKTTLKEFFKSIIEFLPGFLSGATTFFNTVSPVVLMIGDLIKSILTLGGTIDIKTGSKIVGFALGLGAIGKIGKILVGVFAKMGGSILNLAIWMGSARAATLKLKLAMAGMKATELWNAGLTGAGTLGGVGKGIPGRPRGTSGPIVPVAGGKPFSGPLATKLAPLGLVASLAAIGLLFADMYATVTDGIDHRAEWLKANPNIKTLDYQFGYVPPKPDVSNLTRLNAPSLESKNNNRLNNSENSVLSIKLDDGLQGKITRNSSKTTNTDTKIRVRSR